jgi:putative membrane protein
MNIPLSLLAQILIVVVMIEHLYILWFEMFAWETKGKEVFKGAMPAELFKPTKGLAANQGLYNGFLAAGLAWSLLINDMVWQKNVALFFLGCVAIAGIYGGLTASKKILIVQALPALIAIAFVLWT